MSSSALKLMKFIYSPIFSDSANTYNSIYSLFEEKNGIISVVAIFIGLKLVFCGSTTRSKLYENVFTVSLKKFKWVYLEHHNYYSSKCDCFHYLLHKKYYFSGKYLCHNYARSHYRMHRIVSFEKCFWGICPPNPLANPSNSLKKYTPMFEYGCTHLR